MPLLSHCSRMLICLQLEEHLLAYYRTWQVNLNEYVSKANSEFQCAIIDAHIRNPVHSNNVPSHVPADFQPRIVSAGKLPDAPCFPPVPPAITMRRQLDELLVIQGEGEEIQWK